MIVGVVSCSVFTKFTQVDIKPLAVNEFLVKPFGFNESIDNFKQKMPYKTKIQKLIKRSSRENHRPDTIYNFNFKKSKISVYKTRFNQEFVLGGIVKNSEIELVNGIRQGMKRDDFFKSFVDLPENRKDTVIVKDFQLDRAFNFYFDKRNRLSKFTFTGRKATSN
jgi:hypothetical protein